MNILITGGLGYIGSHTVIECISNNHNVIIVDNLYNSSIEVISRLNQFLNKDLKFYQTDMQDIEAFEKVFIENNIEAVIHFAGYKAVGESVEKPLKYYDNNIGITINLLKLMERYNVKQIIFSSSATVYKESKILPLTENMPLGVTNPYGRTKLIIEEILQDIAYVDKNFKAVILRYFNPIGAHPCGLFGEENNGIPNNLMPYIVKVAKGELEYLRVFGNDYNTKDGTGVRDYIHVVDLAKAHIKAIKAFEFSKNINIYNIGTGTGYSVLEIIHNFEKATGIKIPYKIVERRSGDIGENYSNSDKAKKELNFSTKYGILEMCKDAWNYEKVRE